MPKSPGDPILLADMESLATMANASSKLRDGPYRFLGGLHGFDGASTTADGLPTTVHNAKSVRWAAPGDYAIDYTSIRAGQAVRAQLWQYQAQNPQTDPLGYHWVDVSTRAYTGLSAAQANAHFTAHQMMVYADVGELVTAQPPVGTIGIDSARFGSAVLAGGWETSSVGLHTHHVMIYLPSWGGPAGGWQVYRGWLHELNKLRRDLYLAHSATDPAQVDVRQPNVFCNGLRSDTAVCSGPYAFRSRTLATGYGVWWDKDLLYVYTETAQGNIASEARPTFNLSINALWSHMLAAEDRLYARGGFRIVASGLDQVRVSGTLELGFNAQFLEWGGSLASITTLGPRRFDEIYTFHVSGMAATNVELDLWARSTRSTLPMHRPYFTPTPTGVNWLTVTADGIPGTPAAVVGMTEQRNNITTPSRTESAPTEVKALTLPTIRVAPLDGAVQTRPFLLPRADPASGEPPEDRSLPPLRSGENNSTYAYTLVVPSPHLTSYLWFGRTVPHRFAVLAGGDDSGRRLWKPYREYCVKVAPKAYKPTNNDAPISERDSNVFAQYVPYTNPQQPYPIYRKSSGATKPTVGVATLPPAPALWQDSLVQSGAIIALHLVRDESTRVDKPAVGVQMGYWTGLTEVPLFNVVLPAGADEIWITDQPIIVYRRADVRLDDQPLICLPLWYQTKSKDLMPGDGCYVYPMYMPVGPADVGGRPIQLFTTLPGGAAESFPYQGPLARHHASSWPYVSRPMLADHYNVTEHLLSAL